MKFTMPFMFGLASAAAISSRQNNVDVDEVCRNIPNGLSSIMCGMVITYSQSPDLGSVIEGDFGISEGSLAAHVFNRECEHQDAYAFEPKRPGYKSDFEVEGGDVSVSTHCVGVGCLSNDFKIGPPQISFGDWAAEDGALWECQDPQSYTQGLDVLHFVACKFQCRDVNFDQ